MSGAEGARDEKVMLPNTTVLMLSTFAELHRQESGAEEDVYRTLPFFATALGIAVAAIGYAASRLPRWTERAKPFGSVVYIASAALLGLSVIEISCVLALLSQAVKQQKPRRIGPEEALIAAEMELRAYNEAAGLSGDRLDEQMVFDLRQLLLRSFEKSTPFNRGLNEQRYRLRSRASLHLLRSLFWALAATTIMFASEKLGYSLQATPGR